MGGESTAHVPEVAQWSNSNGTQKIKIIKNYSIYKMLGYKKFKETKTAETASKITLEYLIIVIIFYTYNLIYTTKFKNI